MKIKEKNEKIIDKRSIRHNIVGSLVSTVILKGLALLPDASFGLENNEMERRQENLTDNRL